MDIIKNAKNEKTNDLSGYKKRLGNWLEKRIRISKYVIPTKSLLLASAIILIITATTIHLVLASMNVPVDPKMALEKEIETITAQIGKTMELPADEKPTLATVTDKGKLKSQDFFENAKNGDKLLIFAKAKKAILFRPTTGKIIDFTNLTSSVVGSND